ncbi:MAG: tetratricopeptide (TPR) repeat protein [Saprospiraceae bacterium]|jgi:tetratricopeptide (TPR) repeat protein
MSPLKITQQAEKIRNLIIEDDLESAFEILMELAKKADGNYWDESLNLNQDYTKLTNETRSGFLTPIQAETNRNLLIDKMLKLTRLIENNNPNEEKPIPAAKETSTITKTIEVHTSPATNNLSKILLGVLGISIFGALVFFLFGNEEVVQPEIRPTMDVCIQTMDEGKTAFKNGDLDKAERIFITAKDACADKAESNKWLERVEVMRQRNAEKEATTTNIPTIKQEEKAVEKPNQNKPRQQTTETKIPDEKEETITPVRPTFPEESIDSRAIYVSYLKKGDKAFFAKNYVDAYEFYKQAKAIDPTSEIRGKLETTRDLCYRQFFSAGMDDYNVQQYKEALKDFKKAQYYKNFTQVKGMIRRCETALE